MGYTHYWTLKCSSSEENKKKFKKAVTLLKKCLKEVQVPLAGGNGTGKPVFKDNYICFNGVGEDSYETCYIGFDDGFNFCKTVRKPYDVVVCLALLCFKIAFGDDFEYSSDGNEEDDGWKQAIKVFNEKTSKND